MNSITKTINANGEEVSYHYGSKYSDPNRGPDLRKNGDKPKGYQISEMWDSHHEIARLLLLGEKSVNIAKELKCSVALISNVKNSPVVKEKLVLMRAARDSGTVELSKQILALGPIAVKRVAEAVQEGKVLGKELSASGIMREANNVIDRVEGKPTQTIHTRNIHGHFTLDDIQRIKDKAKELAGSSDQMVAA